MDSAVNNLVQFWELSNLPSQFQGPFPNRRPVQDRWFEINPQSNSPLYNGLIPPEIRDQIFMYAMTEYTKTDPVSQYPRSTDYTRPGYSGARTITVGLLLTCRRVYTETYHLPPASKEHVFWHGRGPKRTNSGQLTAESEDCYFQSMKPWQRDLVKEIHLFTQMYWLESSFMKLCRKDFMKGIEKVKITFRRGDWWWNERNAPLSICPQSGSSQNGEMYHEWEMEKKGHVIQWKKEAWGYAFAELKNLKELEIEFEAAEHKVEELKAIAKKAKEWKFPLNGDMVLSTNGLTKVMEWRTDPAFWNDICPYCNAWRKCRGGGRGGAPVKDECREMQRLKMEGKGPMCTIITLRWRRGAEAQD